MSFIYKIKNTVNNKIYIGKTKASKVEKRWNQHRRFLRTNRHPNKHLQASWNKYGENSFVFEIVEVFESKAYYNLENVEKFWILVFESKNPQKGYNKTDGGEGIVGYKMPRDIVERIAAKNRGRPSKAKGKPSNLSSETRKKISDRQKTLVGEKNNFFGKKHSVETRQKMKSFWLNKERRDRHTETHGKKIICLNNGKVYKSSVEAANDLNLRPSSIRSVLQGKSKALKGFKFQYYQELKNA